MLEIIRGKDMCPLLGTCLILILVGNVFTTYRQKWWGGFLALTGFVAFGAYSLWSKPPSTASSLFEIALASLILLGLVLGAAWVTIPLVGGIISHVSDHLKGLGADDEESRRRQEEQRLASRCESEAEKNRREEADKDRIEKEKAVQEKGHQEERKQKTDLRSKIEILFQMHQHAISSRLDKQTLMDWIARYMCDDQPLDALKARATEMEQLILSIVKDLDIPKPAGPSLDVLAARKEVESMYQERPLIHAVYPPRQLQAEIKVRIPDTATPEIAWKEARDMMKEIMSLEEEEKARAAQPSFNPPVQNI